MSIKPLRRIQELYRIGGTAEIFRGVRDYCYDRAPLAFKKGYYEKRTDNTERWEFIWPHIVRSSTLIDIGCAEGFFTVHSAGEGIFSLGIDNSETRLERARDSWGYPERCGFLRMTLSPENIDQLPQCDVVLLLTVHHHWEHHYGLDAAERMFEVVMDRCELLVYEPPGDRPLIKEQKGTLDPEQSSQFYTDRLHSLYPTTIDIIDETMVDYRSDRALPRKDPLFVIDTSNHSLTHEPS